MEALVTVALVGFLGMATLQINPGISARVKDQEKGFNCENHITSVMATIRGGQTLQSVMDYHPFEADRYPSPAERASLSSITVSGVGGTNVVLATDAQLWTDGSQFILGTATPGGAFSPAPLRSSLLLKGVMRALNAVYNDNSPYDYCSAGATYTAVDTIGATTTKMIARTGVTTTMRIRPYSLTTGEVLTTCPRPLSLRPRGSVGTSAFTGATLTAAVPAAAGNLNDVQVVSAPTNFRNDYGLRVEITVSGAGSCSRTYNMAYSMDASAPATPDHVFLTSYLVNGVAKAVADSAQPASTTAQKGTSVTLEVGYSANVPEAGSQILCRDVSMRVPLSTSVACYRASDGTPGNPGPQKANGPGLPTLDLTYDSGNMSHGEFFLTGLQSQWVPCETVTVCGQAPTTTVAFTPTGTAAGRYGIRNTYPALRAGCFMNVEVVAVDVSGNRSAIAPTRASATVPTLETTRPSCGNWCVRDPATWPVGTNSYWQMGSGCCVGVGCTVGKNNPAHAAAALSTDTP